MIPNSSNPDENFTKAVTRKLDSKKKVEIPLEERLLMEITNKTLDIHDSVQKLARTISAQRDTIVFKDEALIAAECRYDKLVEQHTKDAHGHAVNVKGLLDRNAIDAKVFKGQLCVREEEIQTCNLVVKSQREEIVYLKKSMETMNRALKSQEDCATYATGQLRKIRSSVIYAIRYSIGLV